MEDSRIVHELSLQRKLLEQMAADIATIKELAIRAAPPMTPEQQKASLAALNRKMAAERAPSKT